MSILDRDRPLRQPIMSAKALAPERRISPGKPAGEQMAKSPLSAPIPKGRDQTGAPARQPVKR